MTNEDERIKLSRWIKYLPLAFLILLNIILRLPTTPHQHIGAESFFIYGLAESISTYGYAKWIIHPLSVFGYYPYSYASAVPLILSEMSQITGLSMEWTIWMFCIIEGILAALFAYIMAGEIKNNELFKFIVALAFSISSGMLWFTTWIGSPRGPLLVFMPLFIYFLLKTRTSSKIKYGSLCAVIFVFSMIIHNLYFFLVLILIAYYSSILLYKFKDRFSKRIKISRPITFLILIALFGFLFYMPFSSVLTKVFSHYTGSDLGYKQILVLAITYGGRIGILVFIGVFGLIMLLYKKEKSQLDLFLIILALLFTALLFNIVYASLSISILAAILIGVGFIDLTKFLTNEKAKLITIAIIIVVAVSWAGLAQVWHPGVLRGGTPLEIGMTNSGFNTALWIDHHVNTNERVVVNAANPRAILAVSGAQSITQREPYELINGFVDEDAIKVKLKPIYLWPDDGPFALKESYQTHWKYGYPLYKHDCDDLWSAKVISKFNLMYSVENVKTGSKTKFFESVHKKKDRVYANNQEIIYYLRKR
jgi:hypothetical protein